MIIINTIGKSVFLRKIFPRLCKRVFYFLIFFLSNHCCWAGVIIVPPNSIIDKNTRYDNVILDFSQGNFTIKNKALLSITNSEIIGHISPKNPFIITITWKLMLSNNKLAIKVDNIVSDSRRPASYYLFKMLDGIVDINRNTFTIDKAYTVGLFYDEC